MLQVGVSTASLYPMASEDALKTLISHGCRNFEFFINAFSEMELPFLKEFQKQLSDCGGTVHSLHPCTCPMETLFFFSDYERRTQDSLDFYRKYFQAANYLGADIFVLHGQMRGRKGVFMLTDEEYCRRFQRLHAVGKEYGVRVCQENVDYCRAGSTEFIKTMGAYLKDEAEFVFDIKQCRLRGEDPQEMLRAMGSGLRHVHLSDSKGKNNCLLPGEGDSDLPALKRFLENLNYGGAVILEVYADSYESPQQIKRAMEYTERCFGPK